jgi:Sedlin, N-terminal conserved region
MAAVSLAIIGKNNEPLYMREFFFNDDNLHNSSAAGLIPTEEELFGICITGKQQDKQNENEENNNATTTFTATVAAAAAASTSFTTTTKSSFSAHGCSLRQQFLLHAALDRFEELSGPPPGFAWRRRNNTTAANTTTTATAVVVSPTFNANANTNTSASAAAAADAFVGLLCPLEEFRVYGFMTTTRVKFLLTIREDVNIIVNHPNDNNPNIVATTTTTTMTMDEYLERIVKGLFIELHQIYVEYALNPFSPFFTSGPIISQRFDNQVLHRIHAYNIKNIMSSSWQHP